MPTLPSTLLESLKNQIPHRLRSRDCQCLYLHGVFQLTEAPSGAPLREGLLNAALEHVMLIDVEIK